MLMRRKIVRRPCSLLPALIAFILEQMLGTKEVRSTKTKSQQVVEDNRGEKQKEAGWVLYLTV
jgi:hypothetical protein